MTEDPNPPTGDEEPADDLPDPEVDQGDDVETEEAEEAGS